MFIIFTSISSISAQESDEKNIEELHSIGASLISEGRYEESIRYYDKILEIDPDEVRALLNKGSVLIQLQKYEESIRYYDKILEIDPDEVRALASKTIALSHLERYSEAQVAIEKAITLEPQNQEIISRHANFLAGIPTSPAHNSIYDINFRVTLKDSSGNLVTVAESTNTRYLAFDITDEVLANEFTFNDTIVIDGILYERAQKTEEYTQEQPGESEMHGMWSFTTRYGGYIINIFEAFTPYITIHDGDLLKVEWYVLKKVI